MIEPWLTLGSREVYSGGPWVRVVIDTVKLPDGRVVNDYHRVEFQDCCIVYAQTVEGMVVVERQYKHGVGSIGLSLPAGGLAPGEEPLAGARRELLEETGYAADTWRSLGAYAVNGNYGCGRAHLFVATGARKVAEPDSGDLEDMEILLMSRPELLEATRGGLVHLLGAVTVIGLAGQEWAASGTRG